ncbi:hypothetical protein C8039_12560 [Halogeometricum sp. wsp3]|nr:hypothetical protein C8039_12560 [Halogeometricum sp. wsp3]
MLPSCSTEPKARGTSEADRPHQILDLLRDSAGAGDHVVFLILWKTAMRRSTLRYRTLTTFGPTTIAGLEHRIDEANETQKRRRRRAVGLP